jgi:maltooligosyltrehalose synthase
VAFSRTGGLAVVVPRLVTGLAGVTGSAGGASGWAGGAGGASGWAGTTVALPGGAWTDVLTGDEVYGGSVSAAALLRRFPVAVLAREA